MNSSFLSILTLFLCFFIAKTNAQSSLYFNYDMNCVQKLDYKRTGVFHDIEFTDYIFQPSNKQKVIFRVQRIAINKTTVEKLSIPAWGCAEQSKINNTIINNINQLNTRLLIY